MKLTKNQLKRLIKEEISKVLSEDEEEQAVTTEAEFEQYINDNPLHGISPEMSKVVFVTYLRAGEDRVESFEEAKDAYDHLRATMDPNDASHQSILGRG